MAQELIRFGLVSAAISFEPVDDIRIETYGDRLFRGPVELADFGSAPVKNERNIGKINVLVFFCGERADVSLLFFCEFPHRLSFRAIRQRGLR